MDVEYIKEGANWILRVYIDKDGGINIEDCQIVSEELGKKLDEVDPIERAYHLEVSSPGYDRPLKTKRDFEKYKGEEVEVLLYSPVNGKKTFEGKLIEKFNNSIIIEEEGKRIEFENDKVAKVKRVLKF